MQINIKHAPVLYLLSLPQTESRVRQVVPRKVLDGEFEKPELKPTEIFEIVGYQYDFQSGKVRSNNTRWQVVETPVGSSTQSLDW